MPPIVNWPTAYELTEAVKQTRVDITKYIGMKLLAPYKTTTAQKIVYYVQHAAGGMTHPHTLNGDPKAIKKDQRDRKEFSGLYFKEEDIWNEEDILTLASFRDDRQRMTLDEMLGDSIGRLKNRAVKRMEWAIWQSVLTNKVTVTVDKITQTATYEIPTGNLTKTPPSGVTWDTAATAKPIGDLETARIEWFTGTGYDLGTVIMNSKTLQYLANAEDTYTKFAGAGIGEKYTVGLAVKILEVQFPGLQFVIYDGIYDDEAGNCYKLVPDGKVILWPNAPLGEIMDFVSTPSIHNGGARNPQPGIFAMPVDKTNDSCPSFKIVGGVYGAPRIYRPAPIFVMTVV